jgi:hypothetical protein
MLLLTLVVALQPLLSNGQFGTFDYYDSFDSPSQKYKGKYIGDLSTFHHQVSFIK